MIVKVQRPLAGTPPQIGEPDILVYDEHREHRVKVHKADLPKWLKTSLERSPKVFVEAAWDDGWTFLRPATWQPW